MTNEKAIMTKKECDEKVIMVKSYHVKKVSMVERVSMTTKSYHFK
jgi:hypothetical protein